MQLIEGTALQELFKGKEIDNIHKDDVRDILAVAVSGTATNSISHLSVVSHKSALAQVEVRTAFKLNGRHIVLVPQSLSLIEYQALSQHDFLRRVGEVIAAEVAIQVIKQLR